MTDPLPTLAELRAFFAAEFPQTSVTIERIAAKSAVVRQSVAEEHLRPGATVSGPVMMAVADCAAYAALLSAIGIVPLAVTTSLHINFLNKPSSARAIVGEATLLKLGRRLAVADIRVFSEGEDAPVAQATVTYSIPPKSRE